MKKLSVILVAAFVLPMSQGLKEVAAGDDESIPRLAQVVALDECDPVTFNAAVGPDFCRNVTLGAFTTLSELFTLAEAGTPDPGWDFEPDKLTIKEGWQPATAAPAAATSSRGYRRLRSTTVAPRWRESGDRKAASARPPAYFL
jgi:hypothetical protein